MLGWARKLGCEFYFANIESPISRRLAPPMLLNSALAAGYPGLFLRDVKPIFRLSQPSNFTARKTERKERIEEENVLPCLRTQFEMQERSLLPFT